jgi:hypothetical protein
MPRRRRIGLLSATAASTASLAPVFSISSTAVAATADCNIEVPAAITYDSYDRELQLRLACEAKAVESAKQQAVLDKYAQQILSDACDGYFIPFIESIYVSLYGDAADQAQWTDSVQEIFLDTVLGVLNDCTDDCIRVDSVELELLERDSVQIDQVFSNGSGENGNGRYLADLGNELYLTDDGEMTSTYRLASNGTAAAASIEEARQLQDLSSTVQDSSNTKRERDKTQDRRRKKRARRNVAKLKTRGLNKSSGRRTSLLEKRAKKYDDIKGGGDGRHLEEDEAGECGAVLMERLADTNIDIFRCIANVELTSYNPIACIDGKLIDTTTNQEAELGRSPAKPDVTARLEDDEEEELKKRRKGNRPRN